MSINTGININAHLLEEDMPESQPQINLSDYLKSVLKQLYVVAQWFVTGNLAIYPPGDRAYPFGYITPDIGVFPVVLSQGEQSSLNSWQMRESNRPAPTVVFEISSEGTWQQDLDPKPQYYQLLGVREYFSYDPQRYWRNATTQLRGWRYTNNTIEEIQPDNEGRLWSVELNSWLKPDGAYVRLYDPQGNLRLTEKEAADQRAEAERIQKEVERAEKEAILEKLRKLNIDIDSL